MTETAVRIRWRDLLVSGGCLIGISALLGWFGDADRVAIWTLLSVALIFLGLDASRCWPGRAKFGFALYTGAVGASFVPAIARRVAHNLDSLFEWDYLGFWLHARTAVLGLDFYEPLHAAYLAEPYSFNSNFRTEIVDAGFWYPPPSMFLFWPLGFFDPVAAMPFWYAFQAAVIVVVVILLQRLFLPGYGVTGWLACAALVLACHGTYQTFFFSQTNFVGLLAFLLFWRFRDSWFGGLWVPVAMFVKPYLAVIGLAPLLGRRWRVVLGMAGATALLLLGSMVAFGAGTFSSYFTRDQVAAKPDWIYVQPTNQSLLGLVLRMTESECSGMSCVTHPIFLVGSLAVGLISLVVGIGLQRVGEERWAIALYLLMALIVYPVSQLFYSVMLVPVALLVWQRRHGFVGGVCGVSILLSTIYALLALQSGRTSSLGFLLLWCFVAWAGFRLIQGSGWPLRPAESRPGS